MRGIRWLPLAALALACAGQPEASDGSQHTPDQERKISKVEELPPRPSYPNARRGLLVTRSAGDYEIEGAWQANAGVCEEIGIVEIYSGPPGFGIALFLRMPEGDPIGAYPVVPAAADLPDPPAALIAVQIFLERDAYGFQAYDGELELSEVGNRFGGRFAATLREVSIDMLTHFVGVFDGIPVESLPDEYCRSLSDSISASSPTASSDATSGVR